MRRWIVGLSLLTVSACATHCSCGSDDELAELASLAGVEVDRDHASHQANWQLARLGDRFRVGDGLRTGKVSTAELALLPSGQAHVEPHTVLRFLASAPERRHLSIETGVVTILAQEIDLEIHTPRAIATIPRGAKLKLSSSAGRERFDVLVGRVVVAHEGALSTVEGTRPLELTAPAATPASGAAQPFRAEAQGAVANEAAVVPTATAADVTTAVDTKLGNPNGAPTRVPPPAQNANIAPGPLRARDLSLQRLESATIHVAAPPVAILIPLPACHERARVALDGSALQTDELGAVAALAAGTHNLRLQCADQLLKLRLVVKRDAAMMDLPKRAQNVRVEADGRRYTVRYQNLLPSVTFAWPGQHTAPISLSVKKGGREHNYALDQPEHVVPSGTLGEGEYRFSFRTAQGDTSPPTTLRLSFDNTARSAYLSAPADGSSVTSDGVEVAGAALLRSRVQIQDRPVEIDDKGRFHARASPRDGEHAITVRVEHPESGVHYYVRRLR
jgi:hypothetical protein